jgi:hypothetical protein
MYQLACDVPLLRRTDTFVSHIKGVATRVLMACICVSNAFFEVLLNSLALMFIYCIFKSVDA